MSESLHLTESVWNNLTIKQKKALIKDAGYAPNAHAYRTLPHIPYNVRIDIEYAYARAKK